MLIEMTKTLKGLKTYILRMDLQDKSVQSEEFNMWRGRYMRGELTRSEFMKWTNSREQRMQRRVQAADESAWDNIGGKAALLALEDLIDQHAFFHRLRSYAPH